ncbi:NusG domain II-containing protein [Ruminococcus flavefaciens]|uniref:NusG domain II-containing protein n=1 Tax=Ruminococcus flavefaciens TaxID=1265 RepID=UPI0026E92101|nr:NusG domain II-containing protein [Ruminococcus flavefaciens]MDD7515649.1 NusG domain II-containing protein [Ruminococcus flavefaciens]MDY5690344.1 NusG domain II-containing protein [Ruminococcus flavefaciens]
MTKGVKAIISVVALMFIGSVIYVVLSLKPADSTYVEIVQNNKVIYSFDLAKEKNRSFRIECDNGGWNEIKIEDGKISMSDADCPDHTCVKTGVLRSESVPIVCLPHRLVIRYADKEQN